jgi:hypothetical protein
LAALADPKRHTAAAAAATAAPAVSVKSTDATGSPPLGGKRDTAAPAKSVLVWRANSARNRVAEASRRGWAEPEEERRERVTADAAGGAPSRASRRASRAREPMGRGSTSIQPRCASDVPVMGTSRLTRVWGGGRGAGAELRGKGK